MKIKITDKPRHHHVNPVLIGGCVYQNLDNKSYYICGSISKGLERHFALFDLKDGKAWSSEHGFGNGRFVDVTDNSTFTVEI